MIYLNRGDAKYISISPNALSVRNELHWVVCPTQEVPSLPFPLTSSQVQPKSSSRLMYFFTVGLKLFPVIFARMASFCPSSILLIVLKEAIFPWMMSLLVI